MKFKNIFIIILVSLFTIGLSNAQIEVTTSDVGDFFLGAYDANPSVCSCSSYVDKILVRNTASYASSYEFSSNVDFAKMPTPILLKPGEEKVVDIILSTKCDQKPELINYDLSVKDSFSNKQVLQRVFEIQKCESIDYVVKTPQNINPCQSTTFKFNITNVAPFFEEYTVSALNYEEYFSQDTLFLALDPGQQGVAEFNLTLDCSIYGNETISFDIDSLRNNRKKQVDLNLNISRDYDFNLNMSSNINVCAENTHLENITINNLANFDNSYNLRFENAPRFVTFDSNLLNVNALSENSSSLKIANAEPGEYFFNLIATSNNGDLSLQKNISLNVAKCYDFNAQLNSENIFCPAGNQANLILENKGVFEEEFQIKVDALNNKVLNETINMDANSSTEIPLNLYFEDQNSQGLITAQISSKNNTQFLEKNIQILDNYKCKEPLVTKFKFFRYYDNFTILVKNEGIKSSQYSLNYSDFISGPDSIFLEPGQTKELNLSHTFNKSNTGLSKFNITLKADNQTYNAQVGIYVKSNPLNEKILNFIYKNISLILLLILLILILLLLSSFSYRWKSKNYEYKKPGLIRTYLMVFALIAFLAAFLIFSAMNQPVNTGEFWQENNPLIVITSNYTLNLDNYFKDPDQEQLIFEVDGFDNISYVLNQSNLTLIPSNFTGLERFNVTAYDNNLEYVTSPEFIVDVKENKIITLQDFTWVIITFIVLIVTILIYCTPIKVRKQKKNKKK